jgi:adenylate cyclase
LFVNDRTAAGSRKGSRSSANQLPGPTVERHLKDFRWKVPADIAHYRDELLKAGVPWTRATFAAPARR